MSAALQLPVILAQSAAPLSRPRLVERTVPKPVEGLELKGVACNGEVPLESLAFYRKHSERILRRYLYASMQVGRAPSILKDPIGRGWVSSRPVRSFEDAVIFVLDVEGCLKKLGALEQQLLSRIVLQEYTQAEAAVLLGMSVRAVSYKLQDALDKLTEQLLQAGLLVLPD